MLVLPLKALLMLPQLVVHVPQLQYYLPILKPINPQQQQMQSTPVVGTLILALVIDQTLMSQLHLVISKL